MALLTPRRVSSQHFHITATPMHWIAEISDFGPGFQFERVYDDACDVGFTMVNKKTGGECVFVLDREERNKDQEILMWHFVSVTPRHKDKCRATVFND